MGFSEMLKKIMMKNWILSKIAFIYFRGRMLKSKNFKMGTSNKVQLELLVSILQRQTFDGHFVYFIALGVGSIINLTETYFFSLVELILRTKVSEC